MPDENGEPWGYELIHGTGSITTLDLDEDEELPERQFPFGFQAPPLVVQPPDMPELSSHDWAKWLDQP